MKRNNANLTNAGELPMEGDEEMGCWGGKIKTIKYIQQIPSTQHTHTQKCYHTPLSFS